MFRTVALTVSTLAAAASLQALASPAGADAATPDRTQADMVRCVSHAAFQQTREGMSKARVQRVLGTEGTFGDGGAGGYSRVYRHCASDADCQVLVEYAVGPAGVHRAVNREWDGVC